MATRGTYSDVIYEVWRGGGNPDLVDYDRVREDERDGYRYDEIADSELRRQERAHDRMINGIMTDHDETGEGQ